MIRFVDSCSWATGNALTGAGASAKYTAQRAPKPNANFGPGRYGGFSYAFNVSAGGPLLYLKPISGFGDWVYDSRSFRIVFGYDTETIFWTYRNIPGTLAWASASLDSAGHIRIYAGGKGIDTNKGSLIYISQTALDIDNWHSIDMAWNFPASGAGQMSLYIDDVLDTASPGQPSVASVNWGVSGPPPAFALTWGNNSGIRGIDVCDLVVSDNTGAWNTSRLGPMRVGLYFPITDAIPLVWSLAGSSSTTTGAGVLNELPAHSQDGQAPDGDFSYLMTGTTGESYMSSLGYRVGSTITPGLDCYGSILGLALSVCGRDPSSSSASLQVIPNPSNGTPYVVATPALATAYAVVQGISEVRPDNSMQWTDGDAGTAWWGFESNGGTPAITQMVLEKVTTSRNVPFSCGGLNSYTYQA